MPAAPDAPKTHRFEAENSNEETIAALAAAIADATGRDPASDEFRVADARFHRAIALTAGDGRAARRRKRMINPLRGSK